jgi:hypothetical protein
MLHILKNRIQVCVSRRTIQMRELNDVHRTAAELKYGRVPTTGVDLLATLGLLGLLQHGQFQLQG